MVWIFVFIISWEFLSWGLSWGIVWKMEDSKFAFLEVDLIQDYKNRYLFISFVVVGGVDGSIWYDFVWFSFCPLSYCKVIIVTSVCMTLVKLFKINWVVLFSSLKVLGYTPTKKRSVNSYFHRTQLIILLLPTSIYHIFYYGKTHTNF